MEGHGNDGTVNRGLTVLYLISITLSLNDEQYNSTPCYKPRYTIKRDYRMAVSILEFKN